MFDDDKFNTTREGGAIGSNKERVAFSAVGSDSIRTRIIDNLDGSTTRLRTRGGFPEFITKKAEVANPEKAPTFRECFRGFPAALDALYGYSFDGAAYTPLTSAPTGPEVFETSSYPVALAPNLREPSGNTDWFDASGTELRVVTWTGMSSFGRISSTRFVDDADPIRYNTFGVSAAVTPTVFVDGVAMLALPERYRLVSACLHNGRIRAIACSDTMYVAPGHVNVHTIESLILLEEGSGSTTFPGWNEMGSISMSNLALIQSPVFNSSGTKAIGLYLRVGEKTWVFEVDFGAATKRDVQCGGLIKSGYTLDQGLTDSLWWYYATNYSETRKVLAADYIRDEIELLYYVQRASGYAEEKKEQPNYVGGGGILTKTKYATAQNLRFIEGFETTSGLLTSAGHVTFGVGDEVIETLTYPNWPNLAGPIYTSATTPGMGFTNFSGFAYTPLAWDLRHGFFVYNDQSGALSAGFGFPATPVCDVSVDQEEVEGYQSWSISDDLALADGLCSVNYLTVEIGGRAAVVVTKETPPRTLLVGRSGVVTDLTTTLPAGTYRRLITPIFYRRAER